LPERGHSRSEPISTSLARSRRLKTPSNTNRPGARLFDVEIELMRGLHTDMRKGFPSLALQVQEILQRDPLSGHLFCF
jgi:hypothetical protein